MNHGVEKTKRNMNKIRRIWEYWCKAIGAKEYEEDRKADKVAVIRTFWVLLHITCCLAIILNAIANHGWKLIGL